MELKININEATILELYDRDDFIAYYNQRKYDGYLDTEIAKEMFISVASLSGLKKYYDVKTPKTRRNKQDLTEEHFRKGELLGLSRRIMLRRVRDGWSIRRAISTPKDKTKITHRRKRK